MIGGDQDVGSRGKPKVIQGLSQPLEIVVGVYDGSPRGWAVDAGGQSVEAIALSMLCTVGIARPKDQQEWLVAGLEHWQHDLSRNIHKVALLLDIRDICARRFEIAHASVLPLRWRLQRQARRL